MNTECQQLAEHLERHVFTGSDARALATSTTNLIWNMVCAAVEAQKSAALQDSASADGK